MPGTLTLVGTPIGNLSDLSPRALEALEACDFIAAEDTRVTLRLLTHFGIKKPLVSYFEHNRRERGEQICARLLAGEAAVLVTDAGMPAVSDPGQDLVAQLKGEEADEILITESMLRQGEEIFLDDMTLEQAQQQLGIRITPVPDDGADLLYALRGTEE